MVALLLTACKRGYIVEEGRVYYNYWNEGSGQNKRLLEIADPATFQTLEYDCDCSFYFAKDKNRIYIDGQPIKNIDPESFRFIGNYMFSDKDSAYFFGFYNDINNCAVKGVDPENIKLISYPWAKSKDILIYGYDTIRLKDISSFVPIDRNWGKTENYVINENKILLGADPNTFKVINSYSGKDKYHTYEFGKIKK